MKVSPVAILSLCSSGAASAFVTLGGGAELFPHRISSELNGSPDFNDFLDTPFPGRNQGREQPSQQKAPQPKPVMPDSQSARQEKPQSPAPPTSPWIARRTGGRPLPVDNTATAKQAPKRIDPNMSKSVAETTEKASAEEPVASKSEQDANVPNESDTSTPEQSNEPDATATKSPPPPPPAWRPPVVIGGVDSSSSNVLQTQRLNAPSVRYYKGMNPQASPPPTTRRPNVAGGSQAGKPGQVPPPSATSPKPRARGLRAWKPTLVKKAKVTRPPTPASTATAADAANKAAQARKEAMAKRQEAAIARRAAERESALQVQQRVAKLREQRRIQQERKRQERLERAASQEETRRLEQNRKRQELVAREEERRALAVEKEKERVEAAANAAAKLAEASKMEKKRESITKKEIPNEATKTSVESKQSTDSAESDEKTSPTRPDAKLPKGYVAGGRQPGPPKAAVKPVGTQSVPPPPKPAQGAGAMQGGPEGTRMKPDSRLPIGNVYEQRAKVAARLARSVQPVRPVGYSNRAIPKKPPPDSPSVKSGPKRAFMRPDARLPLANVDEQKEKAAKIAARLAKSVRPVHKSDATRDSGKAMASKAAAAETDTAKTDSKEASTTKPDSRLSTREARNMDSAIPNYFGQMNQAGTRPAADAKEPIAWVFEETQPPPTLDRMARPKEEPSLETPPDAKVEETPQAAVEEATKAAQKEAKQMEEERLREAQEALRAAEEAAKKIAYERKQIEEQVQLVSEANAKRILEIETRAKRESFRKQRALLAARLSMVQNARAQVLKKHESHAKQRALLTARLTLEAKSRTLETPTLLDMASLAVEEPSETVDVTAAVEALEDPIPPQFRVLSAKYMARLEKAAETNPKSLKDEFEKLRIAKDGENDDGDSPYVQ